MHPGNMIRNPLKRYYVIIGIGVFGCGETRDVIVRPVWESEACNCG